MRTLFLTFFLFAIVGASYCQVDFTIKEVTDSTYRIEEVYENADGVRYTVPSVEVDSIGAYNVLNNLIQRNYERESMKESEAVVSAIQARKASKLLKDFAGESYYNGRGSLLEASMEGDWVITIKGEKDVRSLVTLNDGRLYDSTIENPKLKEALAKVRVKGRNVFDISFKGEKGFSEFITLYALGDRFVSNDRTVVMRKRR